VATILELVPAQAVEHEQHDLVRAGDRLGHPCGEPFHRTGSEQ
jgi:hypothetical protein